MSEKKKILMADDDVQHVDSVKTLLESVGYEVHSTYNSRKVLEKAAEIEPDLILLDVMFAGRTDPDGLEISRALHQDLLLKDIPVIILSGVNKVLDLEYSFEPDETYMPVKAFLEKPIKPGRLLSEIEKILGPPVKNE